MSKPKKKTGRRKNKQTSSPIARYFRAAFGLTILIGIIIAASSFYIRHLTLQRAQSRVLQGTGTVYTRPIPLVAGKNIGDIKLIKRLKRLGYISVNFEPDKPGLYRLDSSNLSIFMRTVFMPDGTVQDSSLINLALKNNQILDITDSKYHRQLDSVWLEPEILSALGNSQTRATTPLRLEAFPDNLKKAVVAIEDERFYSHFGIDPISIARAIYINVLKGRIVQGGSTITQQLAKNLFLSPERSMSRKALEALAAISLETSYSKDEILEMYLNEVFLAQEGKVAIHGFGEAAKAFFAKEVFELTLAEAATLAGIIKAPSKYSPRYYPKRAKSRRQIVLGKMRELGIITEQDYNKAMNEVISIKQSNRSHRVAPFYVDYLKSELEENFPYTQLSTAPVRIHTGIDREYQDCATNAVKDGLANLEKNYPAVRKKGDKLQAALLSVHPNSGIIRAWVGGRNYGKSQFNRVSQAKRQPGSVFKPFVYLTALDETLNSYRVARTTSILLDQPITYEIPGTGEWQPKNYDEEYRGEVTVREALTLSLNAPTVYLADKVGIDSVVRTAELLGLGDALPHVYSLALGSGEVSVLSLTRAYATIANGGRLVPLRPMLSITSDRWDSPLHTTPFDEIQVASEPAVYVLTNIMQSVIEHGTGKTVRRLGFTRPAAGKTGTTSDYRDAWFAGFTPTLLSVVWVGLDDNSKTGLTGAQAAAPIWTEYMKCVAPMEEDVDFLPPPGVIFKNVNLDTGLLVTRECPSQPAVTEVFVEGTEPVGECRPDKPSIHERMMDDRWQAPKPLRSRRKEKSFWGGLFN